MSVCFLCNGSRVVEMRYEDNGMALEPRCWGSIVIWSYCPACVGWTQAKPTASEIDAAACPCAPRQVSLWDGQVRA